MTGSSRMLILAAYKKNGRDAFPLLGGLILLKNQHVSPLSFALECIQERIDLILDCNSTFFRQLPFTGLKSLCIQ